ncbi:Cytochrome P450 3A11, partial [Microtus ochrogaster]
FGPVGIMSKAVSSAKDEEWERIRALLSPTFTSGKLKEGFFDPLLMSVVMYELFPFLTPIYEMLNVSRYPKDSIALFKKFVDRMKENRLNSGEKVKSDGLLRGTGFVICWAVNM